ncbi:TetR/AcrR family transcriptional regulator [Streptomyces sp. C11-1]|uniref:TetR/AcrR family transcriptional regulator n=1 Tax=Streptomyces durocortorensis TaxID=2811104 RepID=A0ABY9VSK3_9ACTN|nr:TetR/AcrR family transcriptional regulator [Streptomyces durocortorensis]WNF25716.1 TetR/AcrR family transcriptional regulator [Streptomyces durocortorensis]
MTERSWGGTKLADRRAARRRILLDTAERLAGEEGCAAVTVRSVCRRARLTDRYFYESFTGRDDLLLAAFERVADEARRALEEAVALSEPRRDVRARAAVYAFVALVLDAPHKGRLLLLEPFADPVLGARSHRLVPVFTGLVGGQLSGTGDGIERRMAAHALVGGLANLFAGWLHGTLDVPRERLEAYCVALVLRATASPEQPSPAGGTGSAGASRPPEVSTVTD